MRHPSFECTLLTSASSVWRGARLLYSGGSNAMRQHARRRGSFVGLLFMLVSAICARGGDLDDLRRALKAPVESAAARERELRSIGDNLQTLREWSQALFLPEWRDDDIDSQIAAGDRRVWLGIAKHHASAIRNQLADTDATRRIAALEAVGEAGELAGSLGRRFEFGRDFVPDLLRTLQQPEPAVVEAAARALGRVRPDAQTAINALKPLLDSETERHRLAAAEALMQMMRRVACMAQREQTSARGEALRAEVGVVGSLAVPVAARGLVDPRGEVRLHCVETMRQAAEALHALVAEARLPKEPLDWRGYQREVAEENAALGPLAQILQSQALAVGRLLNDSDDAVRQAAP